MSLRTDAQAMLALIRIRRTSATALVRLLHSFYDGLKLVSPKSPGVFPLQEINVVLAALSTAENDERWLDYFVRYFESQVWQFELLEQLMNDIPAFTDASGNLHRDLFKSLEKEQELRKKEVGLIQGR